MFDVFFDLCNDFFSCGIECKRQVSLAEYSTFHIGGNAEVMIFPCDESKLIQAIRILEDKKIKYTIIGNGSNMLFSDEGYGGVIINPLNMKNVVVNNCNMYIECGASITGAAVEARKASLSGLEFAYGIPGTLGGMVYMNAGAYGHEIAEVLLSVKVYDSKNDTVYELKTEELEFGYRSSIFIKLPHLIILSANLKLLNGNQQAINYLMKENMRLRQEKQPLDYPSAGSVFKRTQGYFMGKI